MVIRANGKAQRICKASLRQPLPADEHSLDSAGSAVTRRPGPAGSAAGGLLALSALRHRRPMPDARAWRWAGGMALACRQNFGKENEDFAQQIRCIQHVCHAVTQQCAKCQWAYFVLVCTLYHIGYVFVYVMHMQDYPQLLLENCVVLACCVLLCQCARTKVLEILSGSTVSFRFCWLWKNVVTFSAPCCGCGMHP